MTVDVIVLIDRMLNYDSRVDKRQTKHLVVDNVEQPEPIMYFCITIIELF